MNGHRAVAAKMAVLIVAGTGCSGSVARQGAHRLASSAGVAQASPCPPARAVRRSEPGCQRNGGRPASCCAKALWRLSAIRLLTRHRGRLRAGLQDEHAGAGPVGVVPHQPGDRGGAPGPGVPGGRLDIRLLVGLQRRRG